MIQAPCKSRVERYAKAKLECPHGVELLFSDQIQAQEHGATKQADHPTCELILYDPKRESSHLPSEQVSSR